MKIEVLCRQCGQSLLVDESSLPGASEVPCVHCGAMIRVEASPPASRSGPGPQRAGAPRAPARAPRPPRTRPAEAPPSVPALEAPPDAAPAAGAPTDEVVCPRCGLHFQPRKGRDTALPGTRRTVLVVEDMEYFLDIARDALSEHYDVRTATTVEEALSHLRGGGIDALVLDFALGGSQAGMRILEAIQPKPCPILIFTAEEESDMYGETWERLKDLGADDLVRKEMNAGEILGRKVASMLGDSWDQDE